MVTIHAIACRNLKHTHKSFRVKFFKSGEVHILSFINSSVTGGNQYPF